MARTGRAKKVGLGRMDAALDALTPLGFAKDLIRRTVRDLLKVYGGDEGWAFIEEASYKLVIEMLLEQQEEAVEGTNELALEVSRAVTSIGETSYCPLGLDDTSDVVAGGDPHSHVQAIADTPHNADGYCRNSHLQALTYTSYYGEGGQTSPHTLAIANTPHVGGQASPHTPAIANTPHVEGGQTSPHTPPIANTPHVDGGHTSSHFDAISNTNSPADGGQASSYDHGIGSPPYHVEGNQTTSHILSTKKMAYSEGNGCQQNIRGPEEENETSMNLIQVPPRRRPPCYGWISEDEDDDDSPSDDFVDVPPGRLVSIGEYHNS